MNDDQISRYAARFDKVLAYIEAHLDEPLTAERLSRVAHFSRFHFDRQFADFLGTSATRYLLLLRLRRASFKLAFQPQIRIIEIALEAGFENPESFSRAFRHIFGQSPSQFRRQPDWQGWSERYRFRLPERNATVQVEIVEIESTLIAALEHLGPAEKVNDSVARFIDWRKSTGLSPKDSSRTFGIAYDNPDTTEPSRFRFDIAGEVSAQVPPNAQGVVTKEIPGGRCARVRHLGSHMRIGESIYPLYRNWLPGSGEELRDFPLFFHYLNLLPDTPENELVTDIYLPLK